ncbi:uncharacterized protein F5Z01DRAFT_431733 [Emericellopsis atlantica]|uniref:Uncharacterized protein n=1 Tax=Emericellopsis atlantica TaxID=2614577 RepID=A0A9P8CKJ8_9HYPO|nr:uncharacterized protein F5Z01DRAFT_431733 [Emericellopsis atlantica]KAG9250005.1 hypothetical protein F5Z01DRAFT_431733 [Emericellopsis atlantica]
MSTDGPNPENPRQRRSSITQAALSNLFQRGPPSGSTGPAFPGPPNSTAADANRRRLSVTTLGLSGASQSGAASLGIRRGSMSTNSNNSDSIDENAIEDDDTGARTAPTTPFTRRMSFGGSAVRGYRPGGSPGNGNNNPSSPPPAQPMRRPSVAATLAASRRASIGMATSLPQASNFKTQSNPSDSVARSDQQGFNWSEQLRSRAESNVTQGPRPSFSLASSSPPRAGAPIHDRAKSISDLPAPPVQTPVAKPQPPPQRQKPDAFQERILKGDFYMD